MAESVVRVQALDGAWETVGVDRLAGVWPENLELSSDQWGSKGCTFDLRRDPTASWPDLLAFTPIEVDIDGQLSWSGRVSETPSRDGTDRVMSVVGEGWQHHLDDDLVDRMWVHDSLSEWKDTRSFPSTPLANYLAAGAVRQDAAAVLGWPQGSTTAVGCAVGVTLDLGVGRSAKRGMVTFEASTFAAGSFTVYLKGHDDMASVISGGANAASGDAATNATLIGTTGNAYRYWSVIVYKNAGGTFTETVDRVLRCTSVRVFGEAAYESGNASALKASTVVSDVLDRGTVLLSSDRSGISGTSFNIPEYAPDGPRTPREHIGAVNAFHGWMAKVDPDRRMVFGPEPSRPKFTLGDWSAFELQDAAGSSGADIYNRVLVTGQDPAGQPVQISRFTSSFDVVRSGGWPNPSFDTNTTGWTTVVGSLTRTTTAGQFDTSPGAGALSSATIASTSTLTTGNIQAGRTYRVTVRLKGSGNQDCQIQIGSNQGFSQQIASVTSAAFQTFTLFYTARAGDTALAFAAGFGVGASYTLYIDSLTLEVSSQTLADRRGFIRAKQLQVSPTLPSDGVAAAALGDAWLAGHATTPFRGTINITGPDAVRDRTSGQPVPLHQLLRDTGELIHFADRINPDTGAMGRDARITAVTYKPDTDQATITLDNTRSDLDALLSRLAVVQGAG